MMLTTKEIGQVRKTLQTEKEERVHLAFQALADATRVKIVRLLANHRDLCVTDIAKICNMSVPAISYQMKMLEIAGFVRRERMGQMICYELVKGDPLIKNIISIIT